MGCNNILLYNVNLCRMFHDNFSKSVVPGEGGGGRGGVVVGKYYNTGQERNNDYNYM